MSTTHMILLLGVVIIPKHKDNSGIPGYAMNNRSYLTTEKGFYLHGFETTIKKASRKDLTKAEDYALELVSRYSDIDIRLLHLNKLKEEHTLSTTTIIYQVTTGAMINGKVYITAQILDEHNITLMFNYSYRVDSKYFFQNSNLMDNRINYSNPLGATDWKNASWVRHRNKQEVHRRRYKER